MRASPTPEKASSRRAERLAALTESPLDVLVVGGGITGAGVALDLALRGVRTALVERADWASATSSASSRLIHGGLRYLERFEIGLVRESCLERGLLLRNAAGLVWPEGFVFPVRRGERIGLARLGAGLGLYTLVALPRSLGVPRILGRGAVARLLPRVSLDGLVGGGTYQDGATDDARLTLAVVRSARAAGALCVSRAEVTALENGSGGVSARLRDTLGDARFEVRARAAVLAGGPFTDQLRERAGLPGPAWVRPTRGSHLVLPRERLPTDGAAIFPSAVDGRVMFLIPWPRYTIVGTTDLDADPLAPVHATRDEVRYLLDSANALCPAAELDEDDVVSTWAGLRPLLAAEDAAPSARSREERVRREGSLYTIAGGKLTAFRAMAEGLCHRLCDELHLGARGKRSPTRSHLLVGAFPAPVPRPPWSRLDEDGLPRADDPLPVAWTRRYAALAPAVEAACAEAPDGTTPLDTETRLGEVDWAVAQEDCLTAEDFVLRRTDLGYGPPKGLEAVRGALLERLAGLLGWDGVRRRREEEGLEAALARLHAWRD